VPAAQAAKLIHRRSHAGSAKIRALPHTTVDAPKVLASAPAVSCDSCAQARVKRESHSGTLSAPAPEPGTLHLDLKEMVISTGGYRYTVFLIDEHSRFVFYDYVKRKSEVMQSVLSWETANSTSGWVVLWQSAALTWGSRKQKSIALSTCEAEITALSEAAKDVVYLRKLVSGLDAREPSPTSLSTDSQSARDVSYNPEHHDRMKHVQRRHFFVRDMVESFELVVPFVPTKENPADFFTKPMHNATEVVKFRRIIMNGRS
jgi:hypothetical protein